MKRGYKKGKSRRYICVPVCFVRNARANDKLFSYSRVCFSVFLIDLRSLFDRKHTPGIVTAPQLTDLHSLNGFVSDVHRVSILVRRNLKLNVWTVEHLYARKIERKVNE